MATIFSPPPPAEQSMARAVAALDWARTPLGDRAAWPVSLRSAAEMMLASRFAMCMIWGPERTFLYNDAYAPVLGARHPGALGLAIEDVWPELWPELAPMVARALSGETVAIEEIHLVMTRNGYDEDTWWSFCYSPLRDDAGAVAGMIDITVDITQRIVDARRIAHSAARIEAGETRFGALTAATSDVIYQMSADWREMRRLDGRGFLADTDVPSACWLEAYVPEEDRPAVLAAIEAAIRDKSVFVLEHRVRQVDGAIGWVASRGGSAPLPT